MPDSMYSDLVGVILKDIECVDYLVKGGNSIHVVAFLTQQLLEKTFKLILYSHCSSSTVRSGGHNLLMLCTLVENLGLFVPSNIKVKISTISQWEAATRYDFVYISTALNTKFVLQAYRDVKAYALQVCNGGTS